MGHRPVRGVGSTSPAVSRGGGKETMRAAAAGAAPREAMVRARGVDVFVRERGEGQPLLMINGVGANVEMWGVTEERLGRVARTIVFDSPGTGRSRGQLWP